MKNIYLLFLTFLAIHSTHAQYCGNSSPSICTQVGLITTPGLAPASSSVAPLINGQNSSITIQIIAPDTLKSLDGSIFASVIETVIDSITNLPVGMCWATNKVNNTFGINELGCITISGFPCGLNGQYKPLIHMSITSTFPFPLQMTNGSYMFDYNYFIRVKNATDPITPIDTNNYSTTNFIPYGTVPTCAQFKRFDPTLLSSNSVCEGGYIQASIITNNIPLAPTNKFKLELSQYDINTSSFYQYFTDSINTTLDGSYLFKVPDSVFYSCYGANYNLYFLSTDSAIRIPLGQVYVYRSPKPLNVASRNACKGQQFTLGVSTPTCNDSYKWYTHPDTFSFSSAPSITVAVFDTFQYKVRVSNGVCFIDSIITIYALPLPIVPQMDSAAAACLGDSVTIGPSSLNPSYYPFWIKNQQSGAYGDLNLTIAPTGFDIYSFNVVDTFGCSSSKNIIVSVKEPPLQEICVVTVDSSSTRNIVVWEKLDKGATDSFFIYRESSSGVYSKIASVDKNALSEYVDLTANPNVTGYRYKLAVLDTCGNIGYQSFYHNSIHLQYLGNGNLQWNDYQIEFTGNPVSSYDILRDSINNGVWELIFNVSGTQNTVSDPDYYKYPNAKYRVRANWLYSCSPSRNLYTAIISNVINNRVNGLNTDFNPNFSIYPNPANKEDDLIILFDKIYTGSISVLDLRGKVIKSEEFNNKNQLSLNLSNINSGIYLLSFIVNGEPFIKKVVIK